MTPLPKVAPAAILTFFSTPAAISIEQKPLPLLAPGQILLAMCAAPVNPADLNILEGKYGELPELPATVGNEGVGRVVALGDGVDGWEIGDLALPMQRGTWASYLAVDASSAIVLPKEMDTQQAAMLSVNPATALRLLRSIVPLEAGEWVLQNAANSGVGQSVIQIAKLLGIRTISIVRRQELIAPLQALGADIVLTEDDDLKAAVKEACGRSRPRLALNSVGGASALNLANGLANGGTLVTFGAMSKQPVKVPNGLLIFRDLRFTGFWLTRWLKTASIQEKTALYAELAAWVSAGSLSQPIDRVFPLSEISSAIAAAAGEKRTGKILLDLQSGTPGGGLAE